MIHDFCLQSLPHATSSILKFRVIHVSLRSFHYFLELLIFLMRQHIRIAVFLFPLSAFWTIYSCCRGVVFAQIIIVISEDWRQIYITQVSGETNLYRGLGNAQGSKGFSLTEVRICKFAKDLIKPGPERGICVCLVARVKSYVRI